MNDWFEIFRTGTHTDSSGNISDWTEEDLDKIIRLYDPAHHEAPIVIGHPEHDSPAYGWIEALKREGDRLLAKPKQLVEDFKDWVRKGLYKKISIALYPDLALRHVGFLGAVPPAVKGLATAQFVERGKLQFYDSEWKGRIEMSSTERDPGKEIQRRIKEVMRNPLSYVDRYGNRFSEGITYGQAMSFVCEEDPELAREFSEILRPTKLTEKEKKFLEIGQKIVSLINEKMKVKKSLSYSEALTEVQKENPELAKRYLEQIRGKRT
jgi:hypothetical protein